MPTSNPIPTQQETLWLPIELAPKSETWLVVARIAEKEPNKGAVLWWYRAMFWRGRWRTSRDYSGSIEPSHFFNPERLNLGAAVAGPRVDRALYSELIHIAAELARGNGFLSTCAEDMNPRLKRADVLKTAEAQEQRLKDWAYRVRRVADRLFTAATSSPTPTESDVAFAFICNEARDVITCSRCGTRFWADLKGTFRINHTCAAPPERTREIFDAGFSAEGTRVAGEQETIK